MDELRTLKRLDALVRVRTVLLRQENLDCARIGHLLKEAEQRLQENQACYLAGVDKINEIRRSSGRNSLEIFEEGTDLAKHRWIECYRQRQDLEKKLVTARLSLVKSKKFLKELEEKRSSLSARIRQKQQKAADEEQTQLHLCKKIQQHSDTEEQ